MGAKTYFVLGTASTTYGLLQDGGSVPAANNSAFGWTIAKTALTTAFWQSRLGATAPATVASAASLIAATSGPTIGTGSGAATAGDSFVTPVALTGNYAATAWTFSWNMRAGTAGAIGRIRMRVWKSVNSNGSSPTEVTAGAVVGSTITLSTSADNSSTISWSPGAFSLANQFLFFQLEWEETTQGSSTTDNVFFRLGTALITTASFTYTVAAATGTYALTGSTATVLATRKLAATSGAYVLSGSAATVFATRKLAATTGTYALSGSIAAVKATRLLAEATGTYALTGSAATTFATRKIAATAGTYFLTGSTSPLKRTLPLALTSGAYALSGSAAATFITRKLAAATGAFALTGSTATVLATRKLAAATGSFALTGAAAQVFATRKLSGASGAYIINGQTATLVLTPGSGGPTTYTLPAATGQFTLSGTTGTLLFTQSTIGPLYTVSGPQVVGYLPLQDGIEQVRAVNFPGSTVQRQTATGPVSGGGSTDALLTNITIDHLLLNGGVDILLLTGVGAVELLLEDGGTLVTESGELLT